MAEPTDPLSTAPILSAYADGELDLVRQADTLRRLAADASAVRAVESQVRLRDAVSRVLSNVPPPDSDLLTKVEALAWQMPVGDQVAAMASSNTVSRVPRTWFPYAAAAAVALVASGLLIGRYALPQIPSSTLVAINKPAPERPVPISYVDAGTRTHVHCSQFAEIHDHDGWPADLAALNVPIKKYLASDQPHPDLSRVGYRYVGCGPCGRPMQTGVHLLYQGRNAGDSLSLFIEPFKGQVSIPIGECHACRGPEAAHPVYVWRTSELVFMLIGNAKEPVEAVRKQLNVPSPI